MKLGVIGSSGHVGYALDSIREGADAAIVGLAPGSAGEDMARIAAACAEIGNKPGLFREYEAMLDACRPDGVVVASRFCDHARIACAVMERGIPCFLEKPFALTLEDLELVRAARSRTGTLLVPMLALRYDPAIFAAWNSIRAGAIGQIRLITAQKSYKLGSRPDFYRRRSDYGGTIPWVGSHAVDWMLWFSGRRPLSVHASHSSLFNRGNGEMEISALCHFILEDEIMAGISIDYLRPSKAASHGDDRIRVAGTEGIVEVGAGKATLVSDEHGGEICLPLRNPGRIFDDFLALAKGQGRALCDHEDGFRVTLACLLARQSADEARTVAFPDR